MSSLRNTFILGISSLSLSLVCSVTGVGISAVEAEMSVNGFFPSDYVRTDVFDGSEVAATAVSYKESNEIAQRVNAGRAKSQPRVLNVRSRSGRFAKTTKGTHRSDVQQSEWDVSPILTQK